MSAKQGGYAVGPTLKPGESAWPCQWEQDPRIDDGHLHAWESVVVTSAVGGFDEVVRCASCHAPRCGNVHDDDPCMNRRHHFDCHRYRSGRREHLGGLAASCACPIGGTP